MNYKEIVAEAWEFTQENKKITVWYGAIPAFFSTLVGIGYLVYQYYSFLASKLFQNWGHSFLAVFFTELLKFLQINRGLIGPLIILIVIGLLGYFVIPVICQGALIQLIARRKNGQVVRTRQGLSYGMLSFLPLFEYGLFVRTLSVWSILSLLASVLRNFGLGIIGLIIPVVVIIVVVALFLAIFFTYAEFFIVIDNEGVFSSITKSVNLVAVHLEETLLLTILMLIIGLRIILQILFVFLIPGLALGIFYLFTLVNLPGVALVLGGIIGVSGLFVAAYLSGIIHVFAVTVWTFTFLRLTTLEKPTARDKAE